MRWLIGTSLRFRRVVVVIAAGLIVFGIVQLRSAKVDALPEFMPPTVQVQTEALGLSAPEVEQLITVPVEQDLLAGVPWLDSMRSESLPGLSSIELVFDPGTDLLRARQVVQERLTQAAGLPNVSGPPQMLQPLSSTSRIMMIRLSSASVTPIEMSVLARWTIRPRLLGVPGVANVSIFGQRERQLQVQVDPDRLRRRGVSLQQIIETSGNALWASPLSFLEANTPGTGGFIDTAQQRISVQHIQPIQSADDLAEVPLEAKQGSLRLGDVASVVEDHQPLIGDAIFADGDPGLLLVIQKFPGANTVDVTHGLEDAIEVLRPGLSGVDVDASIYRPADYIERGARNLYGALLIALLLVILALGALLLDWRSGLISVAAMLASLSVAWLVLELQGETINTMVIAGLVLALAIVIDDAVSGVQRFGERLRQQRMDAVSPSVARTILQATFEGREALTFATLIAVLTFVPLFFIRNEAAAFIPPIVWSFGWAVVASMLVALTLTPALGLMLLPRVPLERRESPVAQWLQRGSDRVLARAVHYPRRALIAAAAVAVAALVTLPFISVSALPAFPDGDVLIDVKAVAGTSLPEMDRITSRMGDDLATVPGVLNVGSHIGRAITSDQVVGVDAAQLWVSVDPEADHDETLASINAVVDAYPGIANTVRTYTDERIGNALADDDRAIDVRLYGQDLGILHAKADEMIAALDGIEGIVHPSVELQPEEPTVDVQVDLGRAERYGVVPGDVRRSAATLLSGLGVGSLFEQQKVFDVVVLGTKATRNSLSSVRDLLIDTPDGGHVRLGRLADVSIQSTPTVIKHQDISRSLDVTADVEGRDVDAVSADVRSAISGIAFPLEYHAELVGDQADRQAADRRALTIAVAAAIGIFLLLQAAVGSWRLAVALFICLPLGLSGSVLAVFATSRVLSLGSLVAFFAVFAIAVRFAITQVRHYQRIERDEGEAFEAALVLRGAHDGSIPIVTTAVATGLALVPFLLSGSVAGQEVVHPMAIAIVGGILTSTLLNLFVVPVLYLRFRPASVREPDVTEVIAIPETEQVSGN
jgi:Cu/Ag efflux pump CusA